MDRADELLEIAARLIEIAQVGQAGRHLSVVDAMRLDDEEPEDAPEGRPEVNSEIREYLTSIYGPYTTPGALRAASAVYEALDEIEGRVRRELSKGRLMDWLEILRPLYCTLCGWSPVPPDHPADGDDAALIDRAYRMARRAREFLATI